MEGANQKPAAKDVVSTSRKFSKRARDPELNGEDTTVTEEEVEEFFAILKRIHVAVDYFQKGNVDIRRLTAVGNEEPPLNCERNVQVTGVGKKDAENMEENAGFDLNADPGAGSDAF